MLGQLSSQPTCLDSGQPGLAAPGYYTAFYEAHTPSSAARVPTSLLLAVVYLADSWLAGSLAPRYPVDNRHGGHKCQKPIIVVLTLSLTAWLGLSRGTQ